MLETPSAGRGGNPVGMTMDQETAGSIGDCVRRYTGDKGRTKLACGAASADDEDPMRAPEADALGTRRCGATERGRQSRITVASWLRLPESGSPAMPGRPGDVESGSVGLCIAPK